MLTKSLHFRQISFHPLGLGDGPFRLQPFSNGKNNNGFLKVIVYKHWNFTLLSKHILSNKRAFLSSLGITSVFVVQLYFETYQLPDFKVCSAHTLLQTRWLLGNKYLDPSGLYRASSSTGRCMSVWPSLGKIVNPFPLGKWKPGAATAVTAALFEDKDDEDQHMFEIVPTWKEQGRGRLQLPDYIGFSGQHWAHSVGCLPCFILQCPGKQIYPHFPDEENVLQCKMDDPPYCFSYELLFTKVFTINTSHTHTPNQASEAQSWAQNPALPGMWLGVPN